MTAGGVPDAACPAPTPPQCVPLAATVLADWSTASQQLGDDTSSAVRANAAAATLGGTREAILRGRGGCK